MWELGELRDEPSVQVDDCVCAAGATGAPWGRGAPGAAGAED